MEITPSLFAQFAGVEQAAPDAGVPAGGFSEALDGAGANPIGPPGEHAPPGVSKPGGEVGTSEPNAQSQRPDFLPDKAADGTTPTIADSTEDPQAEATNLPELGSVPAAIAGALALQLSPQPLLLELVDGGLTDPIAGSDTPVLSPTTPSPGYQLGPDEPQAFVEASLKPVDGKNGTAPVAPIATLPIELPVTEAQPAAANRGTTTTAAQPPIATTNQTSGQAPAFVQTADRATQIPWEQTSRRALDDLAFLTKNQDVIGYASGTVPAAPDPVSGEDIPKVANDFFAVQQTQVATPTKADSATPVAERTQPVIVGQVPSNETAPKQAAAPTAQADARPAVVPVPTPVAAQQSANPAQSAVQSEAVAPQSAQPAKTDDNRKPGEAGVKVETDKPAANPARQAAEQTENSGQEKQPKNDGSEPGRHEASAAKGEATLTATSAATGVERGSVSFEAKSVQAPEPVRSEPLTRTETGQVIKQIVDRAEALAAARPRDGVVVHLEPKDLGSITLVVKSNGNHVDAQIGASNEHVRAALDLNRGQLGQAMELRGLNLTSVNIDNQTTAGNYAQTHQEMHQQDGHQAQRQTATPVNDEKVAMPNIEAIRRSVRKADGVDLWT